MSVDYAGSATRNSHGHRGHAGAPGDADGIIQPFKKRAETAKAEITARIFSPV